ncbi:SPT10 Protein SPT10 [Candida maltosa Xu316]
MSNGSISSKPSIEPFSILLKDGSTNATIYPVFSPEELAPGLLEFLWDEYNMEIEKGETLTYYSPLSFEAFIHHWFDGAVVAVMVVGDATDLTNDFREWPSELLGIFHIKPKYPGERCGHICTGEFLVNAGIRGRGIGKTLTECFMEWAGKLKYKYIILDMVLETNVSARKLWESLNFQRIGKIKNAAIMGPSEEEGDYIDNKQQTQTNDETDANNVKFENLRYFLATGEYPENSDTKEKSRLRANKASYYLSGDGKLMVNDREVITTTSRQRDVCRTIHIENGHSGINRTTTLVSQKYHWVRIKETVARMIKACEECKNSGKEEPPKKRIKIQPVELEAAVVQAKSNLSYADVARSAVLNSSEQDEVIHPQVKTYNGNDDDDDTVSPIVRTYH